MANQAVAVAPQNGGEIMESVIIKGDLSKLSPEERSRYYTEVCRSVGLNPLTRPMEYITLNGKLTLYARRDAADQLRKINNISVEIVERSVADDLYTVHVRAKDATGRTDEDMGVVNIAGLEGEARANAILKAITKAKRRVTLSISGLGFLDETEVEDIPSGARGFPARVPVMAAPLAPPIAAEPPHHPETGEVKPHQIQLTDAADRYIVFGRSLIAAVKTAANMSELKAWKAENAETIAECEKAAPNAFKSIGNAIAKMEDKLLPAPDAEFIDADDAAKVLTAC